MPTLSERQLSEMPGEQLDRSIHDKAQTSLAELLRPKTLDEFVGRRRSAASRCVSRSRRASCTRSSSGGRQAWANHPGAPGRQCDRQPIHRHLGRAGRGEDIRQAIDEAQAELDNHGRSTVLFVDEIHRFNKAQQDALLPHVESGLLTLVGTTEHPGLAVNSALLSRAQVYTLEPLSSDELNQLYERALPHLQGVKLDADALDLLRALPMAMAGASSICLSR